MSRTATLPDSPGLIMGRKKPETDKGELNKQVNFRVTDDFYVRIEKTASTLGLDVANFLRMMITRHLQRYEDEAESIRSGHNP